MPFWHGRPRWLSPAGILKPWSERESIRWSSRKSTCSRPNPGRDYSGLEITVPDTDVTEEELGDQIDLLRQRFARLDVVEDRPAESGDYVLIDFVGTIDGNQFDGSASDDYMVEIGSGQLLKGLEDGIVGMGRGEKRHVDVKIPDDFHNEAIAGKDSGFDVSVKEIKQKILPEFDDEFVSESTEHDTADELKADLTRKLEVMKRAQTRVLAEGKVLDALAEKAEVDVPDKLVEMEIDNMMGQLENNLARQNAKMEDYLKVTKSTMDKVREQYRQEATRKIKQELSIVAVSKAEGIDVSKEEIDAEVVEMAQAMHKPVAEIQGAIQQKGTLTQLHASLVRRKTVDWLMEQTTVKGESGKELDLSPPEPPPPARDEAPESRAEESSEGHVEAGPPEVDETADVSEAPASVEENESQAVRAAGVEEGAASVSEEGEI